MLVDSFQSSNIEKSTDKESAGAEQNNLVFKNRIYYL
jgi:hypothetical protein